MKERKYWIAINGSSCAMSSLPLLEPMVTPTPEQLLGFPTWDEARHAQRLCLTAPMSEVRRFLESLASDVRAGRIRVIQPQHPQPPTVNGTAWTDNADIHAEVQRTFIQTTSN